MNEKKRRYGWCAMLIPDGFRITVLLEEDSKKRISISHLLEGNWNFRFLVV